MQILWEDGERSFSRSVRSSRGYEETVLIATLSADHPDRGCIHRMEHEFNLRQLLDESWAIVPLELNRNETSVQLVFSDPGGSPLSLLVNGPMEVGRFLQIGIELTKTLEQLHSTGLVHKDLKPAHFLVDCYGGGARLTGFGLASEVPREKRSTETLEGTFAYMAPEQTGRMNRSIDSRSDLYSLGVTLYQLLTGVLPFNATDALEWVHCHVARRHSAPQLHYKNLPCVIANIICKLLAKNPENRYQSAYSLRRDLERCYESWVCFGRIDTFELSSLVQVDQLLIPEKLYGRSADIDTLVGAFDRVKQSGNPELIVVSGYSGIGKSSVVNELEKFLVSSRAIFISGKYDQYKRNKPYDTIVQAFQGLVRMILRKNAAEFKLWQESLMLALEPNAQLITDIIPELKQIIGEPGPVAYLEPQQALQRFLLVFRKFIQVFARPEHPLVLFLDDLQWVDVATLDLIEDLLTVADIKYLLLVGAYRSNEVDSNHPLSIRFCRINDAGGAIHKITLEPLCKKDVKRLIANALRDCSPRIESLSDLVHDKTEGNPFFVIQFLQALFHEKLLWYSSIECQWNWDESRISEMGFTDNVVDLMITKLNRLPSSTQGLLKILACLGTAATDEFLASAADLSIPNFNTAMIEAVRQGLIERIDGVYGFAHDRIQEAAYSLIPVNARSQMHLKVGNLLLDAIGEVGLDDLIFEVVGQLNKGISSLASDESIVRVAELNLRAALRSKSSTAYESALEHLKLADSLLKPPVWNTNHDLAFNVQLNRAECELLTGDLDSAESRLLALSRYATSVLQKADIACLQIDVYLLLDRSDRAVDICLSYLRCVGIDWSPHPTDFQVKLEYDKIWKVLGDRKIEDLIYLPIMVDTEALKTLNTLSKLFAPALQTDANLTCLLICKAVILSLEYGNCDASCVLYANVFRVAGRRFGDYLSGYRFGQLGCDLVDRVGLKRFEASTYLCFSSFVVRWMRPVSYCRPLLQRAFDAANRVGDLAYGAYSGNCVTSDSLFGGDTLAHVQEEAEIGLSYAKKVRFGLVIDFMNTQLALVRMLRGLTSSFGCFDYDKFSEKETEKHLTSSRDLSLAACWYWIRKLQALFLADRYEEAVLASTRAKQLLWTSYSFFEEAEFYFYEALARAACCESLPPGGGESNVEVVRQNLRQLETWAEQCFENFGARSILVAAELARIEGRVLDAQTLYEKAIDASQHAGFLHVEALGHELAARFYAARGMSKISNAYLSDARYCYLRWGCDGKVRHMDAKYPNIKDDRIPVGGTTTISTSLDQLDLATVLKVSQAVSSEIVLEKLIDTIMRTAIELAGAERGLLLLAKNSVLRVVAQLIAADGKTTLKDFPYDQKDLPEAILNQVLCSNESVLIDDALADPVLAKEDYIRRNKVRSVLCLPLMNQAKLIGVLYFENNLGGGVFNSGRVAILKVVASQAAISLENARLYREVGDRESKIRRLVDANIIGIVVWNTRGDILEANDAFLEMLGYDRVDLELGVLSWRNLTPAEYRSQSEIALMEAMQKGHTRPFEKEYFRKDGSRLPVIVGLAMIAAGNEEGVAFVLNLTERKRAEEKIRETERRFREVQTELAHANRVATMGQLVASIAHEVNQPIAAAILNANAAQRWLNASPPQIDEVRQILASVIKDSNRATEVIGRIRGHIKKVPQPKVALNINDVIDEIVEFTRAQVKKNGVVLRKLYAQDLPLSIGDKVELQQVILNLIVNAIEAMSTNALNDRCLEIFTAQNSPSSLIVSVGDSGPGFSEGTIGHIFSSFYTTKPTGLGMGLAICRWIIEAHGGQLSAKNNIPKGALIQFTLPVLGE
ncbi:AAA family ATPase [Pseudomonas sp. KCJK8927]|uniref:trifunctional serine/threonine-protein kinase/ATP-binding protein/sensor histidine kinase n=1 Tax=Pseudomonas sp. KCJK8927 TaxID=3344560 RepID=UPI003905AE83